MSPPTVVPAFQRRAARAEALARESPSGEEALLFAAGLYREQGKLAGVIEAGPLVGLLEDDLPRFGAALEELRGFIAENGPSGLAAEARSAGGARFLVWWSGARSGRSDYLSRAILRPYAEVLAAAGIPPRPVGAEGGCPFCHGPAWIACRRAAASSDGGQRFLGCSVCGGEWGVNRIRCEACGEEDPHKLPFFQSESYPAVRLETCATCRHYVKSIDLTVDARAIPEVDDLRSLALDLWAGEQGYTRVEPGLAGV